MAIVGFNFKKMLVERKDDLKGKVSIKNNVSIKNVEKFPVSLASKKEDALRFTFDFLTSYDVAGKSVADVNITGEVLAIEKPDVTASILDVWKKNKKVDSKLAAPVLNAALAKCNVQAIILSKEMGLPSPVPLPRFSTEKKK